MNASITFASLKTFKITYLQFEFFKKFFCKLKFDIKEDIFKWRFNEKKKTILNI